jgi:hypothetical protein
MKLSVILKQSLIGGALLVGVSGAVLAETPFGPLPTSPGVWHTINQFSNGYYNVQKTGGGTATIVCQVQPSLKHSALKADPTMVALVSGKHGFNENAVTPLLTPPGSVTLNWKLDPAKTDGDISMLSFVSGQYRCYGKVTSPLKK